MERHLGALGAVDGVRANARLACGASAGLCVELAAVHKPGADVDDFGVGVLVVDPLVVAAGPVRLLLGVTDVRVSGYQDCSECEERDGEEDEGAETEDHARISGYVRMSGAPGSPGHRSSPPSIPTRPRWC